jgi:hypothetical protein
VNPRSLVSQRSESNSDDREAVTPNRKIEHPEVPAAVRDNAALALQAGTGDGDLDVRQRRSLAIHAADETAGDILGSRRSEGQDEDRNETAYPPRRKAHFAPHRRHVALPQREAPRHPVRGTAPDPYAGAALPDRLHLLVFETELAHLPRSLIAALWERLDTLEIEQGRKPPRLC